MTIGSVNEAIKRLIIKRREDNSKEEEQSRKNKKLDKLYEIKYIAWEQETKKQIKK